MTDKPDPQTVREIARERIQAQAKYWSQARLVESLNDDSRFADLDRFELLAMRDAVIDAIVGATVTVSWPAEQPQDMCSCNEPRAVCELRTELDKREVRITELEAENARMRKEVAARRAQPTFLDGQVFSSGWYAHAEAVQALGWDAREAAWRKYRKEMTATLDKADAAPQQPERGGEESL